MCLKTSFLFKECPMSFIVRVPATSANMGPGFDIMGIAFKIYNDYHCQLLEKNQPNKITIEYLDLAKQTADQPLSQMVSLGEDNLFWKGFYLIFKILQKQPLPVHIHIKAEIPLTRGLGSSSTVILASMLIANELCKKQYGQFLSKEEILNTAIDIEGHPDNLAPAMLGGWVVSIRNRAEANSTNYLIKKMDLLAPVRFAGIIPHQALLTEKAREVLPLAYSREDVIFQAANTTLYTYLMAKKKWTQKEAQIFSAAITDVLHEPYRQKLIPGMAETFSLWKSLGCLGAYLSGAGTTLIGIWHQEQDVAALPLDLAFRNLGLECTPFYPLVDSQGAQMNWLS